MNMDVGEQAMHLPWISPCADSLIGLAKHPLVSVWPTVRTDPGFVLLCLRHSQISCHVDYRTTFLKTISEADLCHNVHLQLQAPPSGELDWADSSVHPHYRFGLRCARLAGRLAEHLQICDPQLAWSVGLLVPLGQYIHCLHSHKKKPGDPSAITRRLCDLWQVPDLVALVLGHLAMSVDVVRRLGVAVNFVRLFQLSVGWLERSESGFDWGCQRWLEDNLAALNISSDELQNLQPDEDDSVCVWRSPAEEPLLPDLIHLAEENRRLRNRPRYEALHHRLDVLQKSHLEQQRLFDNRLEQRKLAAMAEFSAGAAHEINNPLAVISGQAQYLMIHEPDGTRRDGLQTIINQTKRVHSLLVELMQYARPSEPNKQHLDVGGLIREVVGNLKSMAHAKSLNLTCPEPEVPVGIYADSDQVSRALRCLLQNAIEAAPEHGWVSVRIVLPHPDVLHLIVEDNGKGITNSQSEHLFDPFYSGRSAGRGRGLGLPIAWRLAQLHDGEVFWRTEKTGSTQFVLQLPLGSPPQTNHRNGHSKPIAAE